MSGIGILLMLEYGNNTDLQGIILINIYDNKTKGSI